MGETTGISWTDATFNGWWGCSRVSPGCERCYAEQLATVRRRLNVWGVDAERRPMSASYWTEPLRWNRKAEATGLRMRVFCASMADVFERLPERNRAGNAVETEARAKLWPLIEATPWLDWLLLTKRPENVEALAPWGRSKPWPDNVWLGVTAEDQKRAEQRIPILLTIPAAIRFVSHEPALEEVDFFAFLKSALRDRALDALGSAPMPGIDWIITGGESARKGARPYDVAWARSVVAQCRKAGVAPFVKQLGSYAVLDGVRYVTRNHKGDVPGEWPADIRVQEFPRPARCRTPVPCAKARDANLPLFAAR